MAVPGFPCPTRFEGGTGSKLYEYVKLLPYTIIGSGRVVVATPGTPVQFSTEHVPCDLVIVAGNTGNANVMTVGGVDVRAAAATQRGIVIIAANPPTSLYVSDLFNLWADAIAANDAITFAFFRY